MQPSAAGIYNVYIELKPNPTYMADYRPDPNAEYPKKLSIEVTVKPVFSGPLQTATFA